MGVEESAVIGKDPKVDLGYYRYILLIIHMFNRSKLVVINQYTLINCLLWTWTLSSGVEFLHSLWVHLVSGLPVPKRTTVNIRANCNISKPILMLAGSAPRA